MGPCKHCSARGQGDEQLQGQKDRAMVADILPKSERNALKDFTEAKMASIVLQHHLRLLTLQLQLTTPRTCQPSGTQHDVGCIAHPTLSSTKANFGFNLTVQPAHVFKSVEGSTYRLPIRIQLPAAASAPCCKPFAYSNAFSLPTNTSRSCGSRTPRGPAFLFPERLCFHFPTGIWLKKIKYVYTYI